MNYWLLKTEPDVFSWDDLVLKGVSEWDGVRNYQARNNMRLMRIGDEAFIYHSNTGKEIVGIAKVISHAHPDSTDMSGVWDCVDVAPIKKLDRPISLAELKANSDFKEMELVTKSRLSVQRVSPEIWFKIIERSALT